MDIPPLYTEDNHKQIMAFLRSNAFGLLVSRGKEQPEASHLPYTIDEQNETVYLYSHMGAGNRHVEHLRDSASHLFIVQGVDHYISSTWYDHENVPTWNYISVHLTGSIEIQQGEDALANIQRLMDRQEPPGKSIRSMDQLNPAMVEREMRGLVAFRMRIDKIEAAKKLSQNRDQKNYGNIIRELEALDYAAAKEMAKVMKKNNPF